MIHALPMKRMPRKKYPELTLLGRTGFSFPKSPERARLEAFPNPQPRRDYWIRLECPDFTSLCPVTGQPDFAHLTIDYMPGALCLETKALKLYLTAYRNVPSFNEEVVNRITDDLMRACAPKRLKVHGKFAPRGGLALSVIVEHPAAGGAPPTTEG
jgi:7-cyano-7-deazaguanine reductase